MVYTEWHKNAKNKHFDQFTSLGKPIYFKFSYKNKNTNDLLVL